MGGCADPPGGNGLGPEQAHEIVDGIRSALACLDGIDGDPVEVGHVWVALNEMAKEARLVADAVEASLVGKIPDAGVPLGQNRFLHRRTAAKKTTWDNDRVAAVLAARAVEDRLPNEDGERIAPEHAVLQAFLGCAHVDYWRKGELSRRGLSPNQYVHTEWGRKRLQIVTLTPENPPKGAPQLEGNNTTEIPTGLPNPKGP